MYGLLIQSCVDLIKEKYGEEMWWRVQKESNINNTVFNTHMVYGEDLMVRMANALSKLTGEKLDDIMDSFGVYFVYFVGQYGYDRILKVLGRNMRDFLNGLDNLHEYLRFSYPRLKPPSFFVEDETKNGLTLTYRSKRQGYMYYVIGQIRQVGKQFYNTEVKTYVVDNDYDESTGTSHVKFRLMFNNKAFKDIQMRIMDNVVENIPLQPELLFELFPFHIVFSRKMEIRSMGAGLKAVMPSAIGNSIIDYFDMERPLSEFAYHEILKHTNNVFQLATKERVIRVTKDNGRTGKKDSVMSMASRSSKSSTQEKMDSEKKVELPETTVEPLTLSFKGQMLYINEWDCIIFLGTPIMNSLDDMFRAGLYINDLSMHDSSRDLVLAGTQQSAELKLALDQEQEKSRLLEESMLKLDQEMQRTDALLYQMIPRPVAERLRRGEPSVDTCQVFDCVTILFSDVVGFTTICSKITPMQVVSMLNAMYTKFDHLSEKHSVYKVETIGDAYMAVSGAPTKTQYHAQHMMEMAMDMRDSMYDLSDPSSDDHMKLRIGCHSGTVVAGVVGIKMPRYCLFGDTVNTASRMESGGEAMKIHISETTRKNLEGFPYQVEERGSIQVKGKGAMKTYWLTGRKDVDEKDAPKCPFFAILEEENEKHRISGGSTPNSTAGRSRGASPINLRRATSPSTYSPVSFHDAEDQHPSDPNSRNSSSHNSPHHRGRSNTMGCPFSGAPVPMPHNSSSSSKIPSETKSSSKITLNNKQSYSSPGMSNSVNNRDEKSITSSLGDNKTSNIPPNNNNEGNSPKNIINSSMISTKNNKISQQDTTSATMTTTASSRQSPSHPNNNNRTRNQMTDGIARVAPMVTTTPSHMNPNPTQNGKEPVNSDPTNNRVAAMSPSILSVGQKQTNLPGSSSTHQKDGITNSSGVSHFQNRTSPIGNGSIGKGSDERILSPKGQIGSGGFDSSHSIGGGGGRKENDSEPNNIRKQAAIVSGGVGCLRRHGGGGDDEYKMERKSKTCYIL